MGFPISKLVLGGTRYSRSGGGEHARRAGHKVVNSACYAETTDGDLMDNDGVNPTTGRLSCETGEGCSGRR